MTTLPNAQEPVQAAGNGNKKDPASSLRQLEAEFSEGKRLQDEMRALIAKLESALLEREAEVKRHKVALANVSDELESFNYSISHDLRAPLRHLTGFSSALVEDYGDDLEPGARTFLDCILRAGRKMETLLEALLGLSRISRQEMTIMETDLGELARHCADSLKEMDPARKVSFKIPEHLKVQADQQLMRVALEHLLGNAWKFTCKKEEATIELGTSGEGGETVFFVRDDGAGFDLRYADRLFGPFQRMHREEEFPGLGIGLATVQRIVHRHGGCAWAEAETGRGTTIYFTLAG